MFDRSRPDNESIRYSDRYSLWRSAIRDCAKQHTRQHCVVLHNDPEVPRKDIDSAGPGNVNSQPADSVHPKVLAFSLESTAHLRCRVLILKLVDRMNQAKMRVNTCVDYFLERGS